MGEPDRQRRRALLDSPPPAPPTASAKPWRSATPAARRSCR